MRTKTLFGLAAAWGPQRVWVCGPRYYNYYACGARALGASRAKCPAPLLGGAGLR